MMGWASSATLSEHFAFCAAFETSKASGLGKLVAISLFTGEARSSILLEGLAFNAAFETSQTSTLSGVNPKGTPLAWDSSCTLCEGAPFLTVHSRPSMLGLVLGLQRASIRGEGVAFCAARDTEVRTGLQGS